MDGFGGTVLRVNLETGEVRREPTPPDLARGWLGGRGFISKLLYDEVPRAAAPLGPENIFAVAPGILSGAFIPGGSRAVFGAISPADNGPAVSSMGGHFGPELKFAGYDLVVLEKQAPELRYLFIDDAKAELRSAAEYQALATPALEEKLRKKLGEEFQVAAVGPSEDGAGPPACVSHDFDRQAGGWGAGAVLESKRIKAIAVRGTKSLPVHDLKRLSDRTLGIMARTKADPKISGLRKPGPACFGCWVGCGGLARGPVPAEPGLRQLAELFDCLGACEIFWRELGVTGEEWAEVLRLVTGWEVSLEECLRISGKVSDLNRTHLEERKAAT